MHEGLTSGRLDDLQFRCIDLLMLSSCTFPAEPPAYGRRRILHCPFPVFPPNMSSHDLRRLVDGLLNFDAIVTDSEFSRRACLALLAGLNAPLVNINVIAPGIDLFPGDADENERENIVLSLGPFRLGPSGGRHQAVVRAFRRFSAARKEQGWRLVIAGDLGPDDDPAYVDELRSLSRPLDCDLLANPPRAAIRKLFSLSKICVSAQGLGAESLNDARMYSHSFAQAGTVTSGGCIPIVYGVGAEAEFCKAEGLGLLFESETELLAALEQAAVSTGSRGLLREQRARVNTFCESSQLEEWKKLLSNIDVSAKMADHRGAA